MKVMPLSEVKAKLSSLIDEARAREEEIVITRNGHGVAVLMSMDVFEGWHETVEILADKKALKEIERSLRTPRSKVKSYKSAAELFGD